MRQLSVFGLLGLLLSVLPLHPSPSTHSKFFEELRDSTRLKKGQSLIVFVGQVGECEKFVRVFEYDLHELSAPNLAATWKSCVLLDADRNILATAYHSQYPWAGPVRLMKDHRAELGLNSETRLAIFSYDGTILSQFNYDDFLSVPVSQLMAVVLGNGSHSQTAR